MLLSSRMFLRTYENWLGDSCGGGGNHMACLRPFVDLRRPTPQL
jgi:hypothetical protein